MLRTHTTSATNGTKVSYEVEEAVPDSGSSEVQYPHRTAAIAISEMQNGHVFVVGSATGAFAACRAASILSGFTTMKNTTAATMIKLTTVLRKSPKKIYGALPLW